MPSCQVQLKVGEKEGWLILVTYISVVLVAGLLVTTWVPGCPTCLLMANPSRFLPPAGLCFKVPSGRSRSSCRDVSQQGPQASLVGELVTGNPMACSISGHPRRCPSGIIAHHQYWWFIPGLEQGHVESINQLAWYHTQLDTFTKWRRQFCSGQTRFDQYVVNPEWLALRFSEPKKQSCLVEYLSFLVRVILNLICWYPICHMFNHRIEGVSPPVFQFLQLTSKGV